MVGWVLFILLSTALTTRCQHAVAAAASSSKVVTSLPGFHGLLPFHLETGYVEVDEFNGSELFYYFIKSEAGGENDPFLLWLTGGDHCSVLSALAFEIGPFQFVVEPYNGTVPSLQVNPYSWTKLANILFVDTPVGAGFSFSRRPEGYDVGEISTSLQLHEFLMKVLMMEEVPSLILSHHYVILLKRYSQGYLVGNPKTGDIIDATSRVPYAHGVGIISDQLYETIMGHCKGEDYKNPTNVLCAQAGNKLDGLLREVRASQILLDKCGLESAGPGTEMDGASRKILIQEDGTEIGKRLKHPPPSPTVDCQTTYATYLSYFWANDESTRDAIGIKDGTVEEWQRCHSGDLPYTRDISSSLKYHRNVTSKGYRALVYSGDHDMIVPFLGTQAWVRSLGFPVADDWRAWHLHGQSAGFTITYSNNMTFATVKGAGHIAPEYEPERCFAMFSRWIQNQQL